MNTFVSYFYLAYKALQAVFDPAVDGDPYRRYRHSSRGRTHGDRPNPPLMRRRFALR